ncbi:hypothetical protein EBZ80_15860 [bacterium]|nr:hypothetical protein [bacterium]
MNNTESSFVESTRLRHLAGVVSDDAQRGAIQHIAFLGPDAVATNGRILAFIQNAAPGLTGTRLVHGAIAAKVKQTDQVELNGHVVIRPKKGVEVTTPLVTDAGRYVNIKHVMPKLDNDAIELSIDASLLLDLAKALGRGETKVTIRIPVEDKQVKTPMLVKGSDEAGIGVIMPIRQGYDPHSGGLASPDSGDWHRRLNAVEASEMPERGEF